MLLMEIFAAGEMKNKLRQAALDIITPFLGQHVPFITIQQIIDGLRGRNLGINMNRGLLMDIINPEEVKAVSKIEGDRIYLADPNREEEPEEEPQETPDAPPDAQQNAEHVVDMAQQGAKKAIQGNTQ